MAPNKFSQGGRGLAASKEKWLAQDHRTAKSGFPLLDPFCLILSLGQEHLKKVSVGGETQVGPYSSLSPHPTAAGFQAFCLGYHHLSSCYQARGPSPGGGLSGGGGEGHPHLAYETLFPALPQERRTLRPLDSVPIF